MRHTIRGYSIAGLLALMAPAGAAQAELTGDLGVLSEFIWRGKALSDASAYTGIDYRIAGVYLGARGTDMSRGTRGQFYTGYSYEWDFGLRLGGGVAAYGHTDEVVGDQRDSGEANIMLGWGPVEISLVDGVYSERQTLTGEEGYRFGRLSVTLERVFAEYGAWAGDVPEYYGEDGGYWVLGYTMPVTRRLDASVSMVNSSQELVSPGNESETRLVLDLNYSFGF